jgi:stage IV sporulation protein FB
MRDLLSWNVSLGRWADVHVRLHVSFLVLITAVLHLGTSQNLGAEAEGAGSAAGAGAAPALVGLAILFFSVVAHELGHCTAAWKCGGRVDRIVLGPWGGLTYVCPSRDRQFEIFTALAGPTVNLAICLLSLTVLLGLGQPFLHLFHPFRLPLDKPALTSVNVIALAAWINWLIVLVNLLPVYPLDGARAIRAVLRPYIGFRTAVVFTWRAGMLTALALCVAAYYLRDPQHMASLACSLLAIFLFFSSRQEALRWHEPDATSEGDAFEERIDDGEENELRPSPMFGSVRRWLERRRHERMMHRLQQERDEEERVDEVLVRLHSLGPQSLSPEDRALLERVSARYRQRQRVDDG